MYFIIISAVNLINVSAANPGRSSRAIVLKQLIPTQVGFYLGAGPSIRAINSGMAVSESPHASCRLTQVGG